MQIWAAPNIKDFFSSVRYTGGKMVLNCKIDRTNIWQQEFHITTQ